MAAVNARMKHAAARRAHGVAAVCLVLAAWPAQAAEQLEYAVKAAYLAKFPFYVEWPRASFTSPASPVNLCVVGEDPFGAMLDEAAAGQQVQGRPISIKRMKVVTKESGCHVAYLGRDAKMDNLRGVPVLVVTDSPDGGGEGAVTFVLKDNRVRFTVDDEWAAQSGLAISSKLLAVAVAVKPRGAR